MTRAPFREPVSIYAVSRRYLAIAIEGLWLLALILVPLVFVKPDFMDHSHMLPKVALYRTLVALMAMLWLCETALAFAVVSFPPPREWRGRIQTWLRESPIRWVIIAAAVTLLIHLVSTLASPLTHLSLFGSEPGIDGASFYNEATHFVVFLVIAVHVRSRAQVTRALAAVIGTSVVVALYAILQHYTADPFGVITNPGVRVIGPMQNPLFLAAYLMMVLPLSLVAAVFTKRGDEMWLVAAAWSVVLTVQVMAVVLVASRGVWISLGGGLVILLGFMLREGSWRPRISHVLVIITAVLVMARFRVRHMLVVWSGAKRVLGQHPAARAVLFLGVAVAVAYVVLYRLPGAEKVSLQALGSTEIGLEESYAPHPVIQAAGLARGDLGQDPSFTSRLYLLDKSWELMTQRPWFAFEGVVPTARFHLLGYGPEMYGQVLPLVTEQAYDAAPFTLHAHNEILQRGVEQGILGLAAYFALLATIAICGLILLFRRLRDSSLEHRLIAAAFLVAVGARTAEQMVGISRVTDMMLWWVFLGLLLPLAALSSAPSGAVPADPRVPLVHRARLAVAVFFALILSAGLLALTWSRNYPYLAAAVESSAAKAALGRPDIAEARRHADNAAKKAPDVSRYYLAKSEVLDAFFGYPLYENEYREVAREVYTADVQAQLRGGYAIYPRLKKARSAERLADLEDVTDEAKLEEALEEYRKLTQTVPSFWYFYFALAAKNYEFGRTEEALQIIPQALDLAGEKPQASSVYYLQGLVYLEKGALEDAHAAFTQGLAWKDELPDGGAEIQAALDGVIAEMEKRKGGSGASD
jgi:O-antigen ligase/tetratricopeptide (TPR) repeat protein